MVNAFKYDLAVVCIHKFPDAEYDHRRAILQIIFNWCNPNGLTVNTRKGELVTFTNDLQAIYFIMAYTPIASQGGTIISRSNIGNPAACCSRYHLHTFTIPTLLDVHIHNNTPCFVTEGACCQQQEAASKDPESQLPRMSESYSVVGI